MDARTRSARSAQKNKNYTRDNYYPKDGDGTQAGKFCSACGSAVGDVVIQETFYVDPIELVGEALHDVQSDSERGGPIVLLAPNVRRKGDPRPSELSRDGNVHLDLTEVDRAAEMAWFEKAFAKELAVLRKSCAEVTIKWGFHQYFM
jgi:hypothetical protein